MYELRDAIKKAKIMELAVIFFNNMAERGLSTDEVESMKPFVEMANKNLFVEKKILAAKLSHEVSTFCKHEGDRAELFKMQLNLEKGEPRLKLQLFQLLGHGIIDFIIPSKKLMPNPTIEALTPETGKEISLSKEFLEKLNAKSHELGIAIEFRKGQQQCFWLSKLSDPVLA